VAEKQSRIEESPVKLDVTELTGYKNAIEIAAFDVR
jgi:hypothetical protein